MRRRTALPPRARIASRASLAEMVARPSSGAARSSKKERRARISGTAEPWSAGPSPVCQYTMLPAPSRHARAWPLLRVDALRVVAALRARVLLLAAEPAVGGRRARQLPWR